MNQAPRAASQILPDSSRVPPWADVLVRVLENGVVIPGTRIGIGLDAVLGFVFPVLGDAATGLASLALLLLALRMRVPRVVIWRIVFNIAIDVLIGCVPLLGDVFDLFWRSNLRNLELLRRYQENPLRRPNAADYLIVAVGIALVLAAVLLPVLLGALLLRVIWQRVGGM